MSGMYMNIEIDEKELKQIFEDIHRAEMTIYECYKRLRDLGIVKRKNSKMDDLSKGEGNKEVERQKEEIDIPYEILKLIFDKSPKEIGVGEVLSILNKARKMLVDVQRV